METKVRHAIETEIPKTNLRPSTLEDAIKETGLHLKQTPHGREPNQVELTSADFTREHLSKQAAISKAQDQAEMIA